ncbi:iron-siderophore ABC transporter substrate-binding protein [Leptolyngbyaceae cyanobacterium UHCC 1019]
MKTRSCRYTFCLMVSLLVSLWLWSCQQAPELKQQPDNCRIVKDITGNVCIPSNSQKIVTLWETHLASALALDVKPIASVINYGDFPEYIQKKAQRLQGLGAEPNLEKILLLKPDLIISSSRLQHIHPMLSKIAPTVMLYQPRPPLTWQGNLETVASILGKEKEANQVIENYERRIENLKAALGESRLTTQVSVATVTQTYGIYSYGSRPTIGMILNDLGFQRPPSQQGDFFSKEHISGENLFDIDGDILFLSYSNDEASKKLFESLQQNPLWQKLNVVQKNRVYIVDSAHWYSFNALAANAILDDLEKYLVDERGGKK